MIKCFIYDVMYLATSWDIDEINTKDKIIINDPNKKG